MTIKIETSVAINRPSEEVFAYVSNFENNPHWQSGMQEAKFTSEGPLRIGSTYAQVAKFLGRRIETNFEVIAYEPNRMVKATSTSGSFPITFTRIVEPGQDGGSQVSAIIEGDTSGFFSLAKPLMARLARRSIEADYANLKRIMENQVVDRA
ncbi:MAG: SRPBCC family protein [Anaerolineae bacterium]|nr:SRPBCC family protein [Anaerolineae bacterium]